MLPSEFQFFTKAEEAWEAMREALRSAKSSIDIEHYIFIPDTLGNEFIQIIKERAKAGVKVRILLDGVGSYSLYNSTIPAELRKEGIEIRFFNPISPWRLHTFTKLFFRDHNKIIIIDGTVGITGGTGINNDMRTWRDTNARIEGGVVGEMLATFIEMWERTSNPDIILRIRNIRRRAKKVNFLSNAPYFKKRFLYHTFMDELRSANKSIFLTTPYFIPDRRLIRILRLAARRGVEVKIIVPKMLDVPLVGIGSQSSYSELLKSGVRIFKYQPTILHAKTAVVDGDWATFGSFNLDSLSFVYNFEGNVITTDKKNIEILTLHFEEDVANCEEVLWSVWKKRSFLEKVKEFFVAPIRGFL